MTIDTSDFNLDRGTIVDLKVDDKVFKYRVPTNEDELLWAPEYMEQIEVTDNNGVQMAKVKANFGKLNICKFENIVAVPYSKEQIKAVIGVEKEFDKLTKLQKKELLFKLDGKIVSKIISEFTRIEKESRDVKKNS